MGRKLVVVLTSLIIFATTQASALGLGDIILESALNQPLSARIELFDVGNLSTEDINVVLASSSDFDRFSLDRPFFLESIDFMVRESAGGAYIELSTTEPVREPYLSFVVEAAWPSGRLLSEYTVLLDLPVFGSPSVTQTAQPPARTETQPRQTDPRQNAQQPPAVRNDPPQQVPERLAAPAPEAADEPVDEQAADDAEAGQNATAETGQEQPAQSGQNDGAAQSIVVEAEDTLWDLALQVRPDTSVTVQQTMLALQELNQDAFIGNNINMIRRGQVLRVPDAEQIRAISQQQAIAEVGRQNQLFSDRRNVPLTSELLTAPPEPADSTAAPGRGELSVVTADPQEADADSGAGSDAARIAQLENELALSTEEVDRIRLQNTELSERLSMLEEQIASAQEIIRLRDLELAQLQQTLAQQQAQTPATPENAVPAVDSAADTVASVPTDAAQATEQPTVVTMAPEQSLPQRLLDALMENSWALLAGVLLVILLLVFLLLRRNRAAEEYDALTAADSELQDDDTDAATPLYTSTATAAAAAPAAEFTFDENFDDFDDFDDDDDREAAVPAQSSDGAVLAANREEEDLLDEADAFIAYERYPEARSLLQNAIVANPDRPALRLKLLELYAVTQNVMGFHLQEAELRGMADARTLARVEELRRRLPDEDETDLPLPAERDDDVAELSEADEMEIELDLGASAEVDDQRVLAGVTADEVDADDVGEEPVNNESDDDFDFDLDDDYSPETVEAGSADAGDDTNDDEFELDDLPLEEPSVKEASVADDVIEFEEPALADTARYRAPSEDEAAAQASVGAGQREDGIESVDFDFSLDDLSLDDTDESTDTDADDVAANEAITFEPGAMEEPAAAQPMESDDALDDLDTIEFTSDDAEIDDEDADEELDPDDISFLTDSDEATTKLDLARAYIDMGDHDGAREILEEVLQEGTDEQIRDAEALLAKTLQS